MFCIKYVDDILCEGYCEFIHMFCFSMYVIYVLHVCDLYLLSSFICVRAMGTLCLYAQ